jgi:hypothetical protein
MLDIGTEKLESNCDCSCVGQLGLSAHIGRKRHVFALLQSLLLLFQP